MRSRTLLPALLAAGAAASADGATGSKASARAGGSKSSKPYYLFRDECDDAPLPEGYMAYGDDRRIRRRDRRRVLREEVARAGRDRRGEAGRVRELDAKCSKSSKSSGSKAGKSSKSTGDGTPVPPGDNSQTPEPTPKPTPKPSTPTEDASCEALAGGEVVTTEHSATLTYQYEAAITDGDDPSTVANDMQGSLALLVGNDSMGCDDGRRRLQQRREEEFWMGRRLNGMEVVGVDGSVPADFVTGDDCTYFTDGNAIRGTTCHVIDGGMTLYLSDGEPQRRKLTNAEESTATALQAIMDAMNQENSVFLEASGTEYSVDGLEGVRFVSGTTDDGNTIVPDGGGEPKGGKEPETVQSSRMSVPGITLLTLGLVALLALAISMVVLRKRRDAEAYDEFKDVDDDMTDFDTASMGQSPTKQAYVVGEEGSMYTSATHDTRFVLPVGQTGNDNDDNHQVDVHHCTSAVCPICQGKETVFVNAIDENSVAPEGYELNYSPDEVGGKRSFEYEPKEEVESPTFDNPAEIERPYVVDDTGGPKTAVVVGATNGIGKGIACRLAREGFRVVAVGRGKEGRREEVLGFLQDCASAGGGSGGGEEVQHEFRACDAFELAQVKSCAQDIVKDYAAANKGIDALVMTQGMATIQKLTPTKEGNDQKLTLHYWSRAAFAACLLPSLRASAMPGGPVVLSVLSGGVHSSFAAYKEDPELKKHYSIANAADFAGFYNDCFFDKLARDEASINFVHASPGFVASNWGTEMPSWLRYPIRGMQKMLGKSPDKCADFMTRPILQCAEGKLELELPKQPEADNCAERGLYIMKDDATSGKLTKGHTAEAMDSVWGTTKDVLGRAGIELEE